MSGRTARTIRIFSLEVSPNLVLLNIRKLDFHEFRHFLNVTSSQNTFKWAPNGGPKGPLPWDPLGSQGSPPMGSLGLPRVPSPGIPWAPKGSPPMGSLGLPRVPLPWGVRDPLPWDPLGSQGFPLPWVPSHGIPLGSQGSPPMGSHPTSPSIFVRPGRILTTKEVTRGFLARSHIFEKYVGEISRKK